MAKTRSLNVPLVGFSGLLLAALYSRSLVVAPGIHAGPTGPLEPDMQREAQRLCRIIEPGLDSQHITLSFTSPDRNMGDPSWAMVATNRLGREVLFVEWHAPTRELCSIGHLILESPPGATAMNQREALEAGWHLLRELGVSRYAPKWWVEDAPMHRQRSWAMRWRAAGHRVYVAVNDRTGSLVQLFNGRQSPMGPASPRTT